MENINKFCVYVMFVKKLYLMDCIFIKIEI